MTKRDVFWAYLTAPLGAAVFIVIFAIVAAIVETDPSPRTFGQNLHETVGIMVMALIVAYPTGLFLLPVLALFEKIGWRGWKYYVPTAVVAGLITSLVLASPQPFSRDWAYYGICCGCGAACAIVFSVVLNVRARAAGNGAPNG